MKMEKIKVWISIVVFLGIILFSTISKAASFQLKSNKTVVEPNESFSVTISGIYGRVSISGSNVSLSTSGDQFVDGSLTITATAKNVGSGKVTVSIKDAVTTGAEPEEVVGSKSINVTIKEKEVIPTPPTPDPKPTTPVTPTKPSDSDTNKKTTSTPPTKEKEKVEQTEEKEESTPQFGVNSLVLKGIKENEETIEITLSPLFKIDTYEYTGEIESDIKKIEVLQESGVYNDCVTIEKPEELAEGENSILIKLQKEGQKDLCYTIKLNKKEKEVSETSAEPEEKLEQNNNAEEIIVAMPLPIFIIMIIAIIVVEALIIKLIPWRKWRMKK